MKEETIQLERVRNGRQQSEATYLQVAFQTRVQTKDGRSAVLFREEVVKSMNSEVKKKKRPRWMREERDLPPLAKRAGG